MPCLIFDFDGTLADTRAGILATAQEVLRRMGLPPADDDALCATIGLPLRENFTRGAGLSDGEADRAVAILGGGLTCFLCAMLFCLSSVIVMPFFWLTLGLIVAKAQKLREAPTL